MAARINRTRSDETAPFERAVAVTLSNTVNIAFLARSLYIGNGGNVTVLLADDSVVQFVGLPSGSWLPGYVQRVNLAGTTASAIVAVA